MFIHMLVIYGLELLTYLCLYVLKDTLFPCHLGYSLNAEPYNLAQQAGAFEVVESGDAAHGKVIAQMVPQPPVDTCRPERMSRPVALIGNYQWYVH